MAVLQYTVAEYVPYTALGYATLCILDTSLIYILANNRFDLTEYYSMCHDYLEM